MTITPPANVNYGRVVWQALSDVTDGPDSGTRPDFIAPTGKVTFVASTVVERNATASPNPVSILRDPIVGVLDSEGYLCTPNDAGEPDYRGVDLIATDDPDLNPTDWVYNVSYAVKGKNGRQIALQPHQIYVPTDAVVDLTTVGPVDNATAIGIPQAEALAAQAAAAAEDASVAASQALAAAAAAEAALADVDSTTAGNLAEPTSETSAATKALVASDIEAGGPVGDAVSAQIDDAVLPVSQQATRTAKAVFNVIDYGATLDGVADDTAALQEAINAAQALAKRACIRIPFGEAKTTGVSITSPFIDLEGPGALRGTLTIGTTTHQAMYCTVRNVRFVKSTGNDDGTGTNTAGNGIELMSVEKVNIEGCQFVGHDAAINIPAFTPTTGSAQQTMQISISSCTFWWTNYALKGRIVSGGSWMSIADIDISDCLQVLTYISAVDLASCDGLKISGSTFFCKGNPYQYKQQNIKVGRTSWVAITGNNLFEPGREAIALTDPGSFSITGNTIAWPGEYVPSDAISITLSSSYTSVGSISGNMASQFTKNLVGIYGSGNASGITIGVNSFTVSAVPQPSYYGPTAHPTSQYRYYTDSTLVGLPQIIDAVQSAGSVSTDNLAGNNYESRRRLGAQHTIASRGIVKTVTAATGIATLSGTNSSSVYGGLIVVTAQSTADASKYASYTFFAATSASSGGRTLTLLGSGGLTSGSTAGDPSFTWSMTSGATLTATPVSSTSGSFTFYVSTLGNMLAL